MRPFTMNSKNRKCNNPILSSTSETKENINHLSALVCVCVYISVLRMCGSGVCTMQTALAQTLAFNNAINMLFTCVLALAGCTAAMALPIKLWVYGIPRVFIQF